MPPRSLVDSTRKEIVDECIRELSKLIIDHAGITKNHERVDFSKNIKKVQQKNGLMTPLGNIIDLNMVKCICASAIPSYGCKVKEILKLSSNGTDIMNFKNGLVFIDRMLVAAILFVYWGFWCKRHYHLSFGYSYPEASWT